MNKERVGEWENRREGETARIKENARVMVKLKGGRYESWEREVL